MNNLMHAQYLRRVYQRDEIAENAIIICLAKHRPTS